MNEWHTIDCAPEGVGSKPASTISAANGTGKRSSGVALWFFPDDSMCVLLHADHWRSPEAPHGSG